MYIDFRVNNYLKGNVMKDAEWKKAEVAQQSKLAKAQRKYAKSSGDPSSVRDKLLLKIKQERKKLHDMLIAHHGANK